MHHLHLDAVEILSVHDPPGGQPSGLLVGLSDQLPHELLEGTVVRSALQNVLDLGEGLETSGKWQVVFLALQVAC